MMLTEFLALAMTCAPQVHATTLQALVLAESEGNPYAIGINGKGGKRLMLHSREEAVTQAKAALAQGKNIDAGWAQINSSNWEWLGLTVDTVFDPCTNLRAAQVVLTDCYERAAARLGPGAQALVAGLSCYNTGNFRKGVANGYVQGVYAQANAPVPAIRGDPHAQALPPLPSPLSVPAGSAVPRPPEATAPSIKPSGIEDGFSSQSIPDGFASSNQLDGFEDTRREERVQNIGLPSVSNAAGVAR